MERISLKEEHLCKVQNMKEIQKLKLREINSLRMIDAQRLHKVEQNNVSLMKDRVIQKMNRIDYTKRQIEEMKKTIQDQRMSVQVRENSIKLKLNPFDIRTEGKVQLTLMTEKLGIMSNTRLKVSPKNETSFISHMDEGVSNTSFS